MPILTEAELKVIEMTAAKHHKFGAYAVTNYHDTMALIETVRELRKQLNIPAEVVEASPENLETSRKAMQGLAEVFKEVPGIKLEKKQNVPYFRADPNVEGRVIRELNGIVDRGRFARDGQFIPD